MFMEGRGNEYKKKMEELPGFRFYPTEEELVSFYLQKQLEGQNGQMSRVIPVLEIFNIDPWNLPKCAGELCQGETEQWFFFVGRQEREARGGRPSRTTASGYWKATGCPGYVYSSGQNGNRPIGVKKTMVFYTGKAPTGSKTHWKINEYRAIDSQHTAVPKLRNEFSLCRVYVISGNFGVFDRRPLEVNTETQQRGNMAATSASENTIATSHSAGGEAGDPPNQSGSASTTNLLVNDDDVEEQDLWEWEF